MRLFRTLFLALAAAAAMPAAALQPNGGPVLQTNFPDPFVLTYGTRYYAYATNANGSNVPMAFSNDLQSWNLLAVPGNPDAFHDAMPTLPPWAARGRTWAPEVIR
ncbi:MAG TPA: glycoside hydrolase, partial [Allosphingosinicella sp.]